MAFQQGLSGLNSSSKAIDVTSNNIANASTVGFKSGNAQFADVYASALSGASTGLQIGIGSTVNAVRQAFTQGNLATSNNPLDLAINGNGFFRMLRTDGSVAYTRNGQFDIDKNGYIVSAIGDKLTGFPVASQQGGITVFEGQPGLLRIDNANIEPRATQGIGVEVEANLDSREVNPTLKDPPGPVFDGTLVPIPVASYNHTTSLNVFDSLGNAHSLTFYFVRTDPTVDRTWEVHTSLDGEAATLAGSLVFNDRGGFDAGATTALDFSATMTNGAADLDFTMDMSRLTQFGSSFAVTRLIQNGYSTGQITGLVTTREGVVQGRYSNGETKDIGKIALANFTSPNGLISLGNNLWAESPDSGQPVIGSPGTGVLGVISAGQVEESNVDLTQELVQLIIQQRNYQANAQSIRTQDQILQTLVNLR
nr:flagellar hook protein FlgE [Zoogloeaceae bacterium]